MESLARGRAFWVAVQIQGVDSALWRGGVRSPTGATWLVTFDSDIHGGGERADGEPSMTRTLCLGLQFSLEDEQRISCHDFTSKTGNLPVR